MTTSDRFKRLSPRQLYLLFIVLATLVMFSTVITSSREVGGVPEEPKAIKFSHKFHTQDAGVACLDQADDVHQVGIERVQDGGVETGAHQHHHVDPVDQRTHLRRDLVGDVRQPDDGRRVRPGAVRGQCSLR